MRLRASLRRYKPQSAVNCSTLRERAAGSPPNTSQVSLFPLEEGLGSQMSKLIALLFCVGKARVSEWEPDSVCFGMGDSAASKRTFRDGCFETFVSGRTTKTSYFSESLLLAKIMHLGVALHCRILIRVFRGRRCCSRSVAQVVRFGTGGLDRALLNGRL